MWNAVLLKFVLWIALSAIAILLAIAIGNRGETLTMVAIGCAGMIFYIVNEVFAGALSGMQRMARPAHVDGGPGLLPDDRRDCSCSLLGWGVVAYATVMAFGIVIPAVGTAVMAWPLVRGHRVFDLRDLASDGRRRDSAARAVVLQPRSTAR